MDYLLRDSYFTGASYGEFDLTRVLRVIRPIENGIAFSRDGMHAVEDYIISRYQMYMQVYFHPASRAMEVLLQNLLKRAKYLYPKEKEFFTVTSPHLIPFFENRVTLEDYLSLDDGVIDVYKRQEVCFSTCGLICSSLTVTSLPPLWITSIRFSTPAVSKTASNSGIGSSFV